MKIIQISLICAMSLAFTACEQGAPSTSTSTEASSPMAGQSGVSDDLSQKNVVQVAMGSKDHSTLVAAIKAADLVDALSNAGPFTVFAPTNAAFDKLPAGTLDGLLKPEKKEDLADILQFHVSLGVFKMDALEDGKVLGQVNGGKVTITKKGGDTYVNDAKIIGTVEASNGIIHVIDAVLLPAAK